MPAPPPLSPVSIVGAGALGAALAHRCVQRGLAVDIVVSRTQASAERLARAVGAEASGDVRDARAGAVVLVCVPDAAVAGVADVLAREAGPWRREDGTARLAAHTSGVLGAGVLGALGAAGADTAAFHPAQSFTREMPPSAFAAAFEGVVAAVEGPGAERARALARALGLHSVVLTADAKARYHLALSLASNFGVTLAALAAEVLGNAGLTPPDALALVRPLLTGTAANLQRALPERALTGPIARGDAGTVALHLAALAGHLPHLLPVYAALATETVRVAVRGGRLPAPDAERLLTLLHAAVAPASSATANEADRSPR